MVAITFIAAAAGPALVTGIAGFALGLIAASVWLHILTPKQLATLINLRSTSNHIKFISNVATAPPRNSVLNAICFDAAVETKETAMKRLFLTSSIVGALVAGAINVANVNAEPRLGAALIAGDKPVTEDQVRTKLQTDGWSDVQISRDGQRFEVTASKNGQADKMTVDAQTGRVLDQNDDDHDDDD